MKLYYCPGACSLASHIALRELELRFNLLKVDLRTKRIEDGGDFMEVNSKGYVPALRLDSGELLTENAAILQYIADCKPAAKLAPPAGTLARCRLQEWLSFIGSEIHKNFSPFFSPRASQESKQLARENLIKRLDWLQHAVRPASFLMGEPFTVADAYLYTVLRWAGQVELDMSPWPTLVDFRERVRERPSVTQALQTEGL
jgi:glutathione S-transferase